MGKGFLVFLLMLGIFLILMGTVTFIQGIATGMISIISGLFVTGVAIYKLITSPK